MEKNEAEMPIPIINWFNDTRLPRLSAGAISAMVAGGASRIGEIVVMGEGEHLVTPCGGCRQRIREFAAPDTPIHIAGPEGIRKSFTLDELLPFSFGPDNLTDR